MADILVVEGRKGASHSWAPALAEKGHTVLTAHTRRESQKKLQNTGPDLLILDGRSLRFDAYRFCRTLRADGNDVPIMLILGENDQAERGAGVNITLREPFTAVKLINRVNRLTPEQGGETLNVGGLVLDLERRTVKRGNSNHRLTPKQAALLEVFMRNPSKILSRAFLMKKVWHTDFVGDTRTLEVHIHWLRRAIEDNPAHPTRLTTVRQQGYCFSAPASGS